jgi:hypothetical protein
LWLNAGPLTWKQTISYHLNDSSQKYKFARIAWPIALIAPELNAQVAH